MGCVGNASAVRVGYPRFINNVEKALPAFKLFLYKTLGSLYNRLFKKVSAYIMRN